MKKHFNCILAITSVLILGQSCKKEVGIDTPITGAVDQPITTYYAMPDTAHAEPGVYMVTYKEAFAKAFADIYTGPMDVEGAKEAALGTHERDTKAKIMNRLRQPDGSYLVAQDSMQANYSILIVGFCASLNKEQIKKLAEDPMVEYIERQRLSYVLFGDNSASSPSSNQAAFGAQYVDPLRDEIGFKNCSSYTNRIWIIDSGIDQGNTDLNLDNTNSKSFLPNSSSYDDLVGHGTGVAAVAAAKDNTIGTRGSAAGAKVVAIKVTYQDGTSTPAIVTQALEHVYLKSVSGDVVNMSIGFGEDDLPNVNGLELAVKKFKGWNIPFTVAAGNDSELASTVSPARMSYEGHQYNYAVNSFFRVISCYKSGYRFSRTISNYGLAVDYCAPGEGIWTFNEKNACVANNKGTSFAAPLVAGILLAQHCSMSYWGTVKEDWDAYPDKLAWFL